MRRPRGSQSLSGRARRCLVSPYQRNASLSFPSLSPHSFTPPPPSPPPPLPTDPASPKFSSVPRVLMDSRANLPIESTERNDVILTKSVPLPAVFAPDDPQIALSQLNGLCLNRPTSSTTLCDITEVLKPVSVVVNGHAFWYDRLFAIEWFERLAQTNKPLRIPDVPSACLPLERWADVLASWSIPLCMEQKEMISSNVQSHCDEEKARKQRELNLQEQFARHLQFFRGHQLLPLQRSIRGPLSNRYLAFVERSVL